MRNVRIVALLLTLCLPSVAGAAYTVGNPITPGTIKHAIVGSAIGPINRTDVGICETISLWIEGASDSDDGPEETMQDTIGNISWTVSGNGTGTVYPVVANAIYLFIEPREFDGSITVNANVDDLFAFADDALKPAGALALAAKVPIGVEVVDRYNLAPHPANYVEDPTGTSMLSRAVFLLECTPRSVDFKGSQFRENIAAQTFFNWPDDGPNFTVNTKIKGWPLATGTGEFPPGTPRAVKNAFMDDVGTGHVAKSRLITAASCSGCHPGSFTTGVAIDYEIDVRVPYEFWTGANWKEMVESHHRKKFRASDFKSQTRLEATTTDESSWMGPWKPVP